MKHCNSIKTWARSQAKVPRMQQSKTNKLLTSLRKSDKRSSSRFGQTSAKKPETDSLTLSLSACEKTSKRRCKASLTSETTTKNFSTNWRTSTTSQPSSCLSFRRRLIRLMASMTQIQIEATSSRLMSWRDLLNLSASILILRMTMTSKTMTIRMPSIKKPIIHESKTRCKKQRRT